MSIVITFTSTRKNSDHDFWWESNDPKIKQICNEIYRLCEKSEGKHTINVTDGLILQSQFEFMTISQWHNFIVDLETELEDFTNTRSQYFLNAGHNLSIKIVDTETNQRLRDARII